MELIISNLESKIGVCARLYGYKVRAPIHNGYIKKLDAFYIEPVIM